MDTNTRWEYMYEGTLLENKVEPFVATFSSLGQNYETFYSSNILPFHGIAYVLCYKTILPQ